jgi:hypothetical protein
MPRLISEWWQCIGAAGGQFFFLKGGTAGCGLDGL